MATHLNIGNVITMSAGTVHVGTDHDNNISVQTGSTTGSETLTGSHGYINLYEGIFTDAISSSSQPAYLHFGQNDFWQINAGDYITIVHDSITSSVYLPEFTDSANHVLWIASDGSTYYDYALTSLAQASGPSYGLTASSIATLTDVASLSYTEGTSGLEDTDTMWINNVGTWIEFPYFDYFKISKKQNQMSEFELQLFDISTAQKAYFKEQAEVLFFCGTSMVLKGRIQTIEYKSSYEIIAKGYGMEVKLLDKQFIDENENRVQYDNISAKNIVTEINSNILTTQSSGIFADDFGNISMRYEYANRLNALGKTADAMDYYWWVSQTSNDNYNVDYLNVASNQGETSSQKTFDLTNNTTVIEQNRDTNNLINYVNALGYGDGINQISTYVYAASTQSSFLSNNITATDSTISCSSIPFNATGSVRIAKEIVNYAGTSSTALTGCSRGIGSTAKAHNKLCYIEQNFTTTSAQTGSSIQIYGLMDHTLIDKTIINEETLEVIASGYLSDRKEPIQIIKLSSDEPLTDAQLNIGDNVTVTSSEANIDGDYRIVSQEFTDNYGSLEMNTEVSNRSLEFIEQMQKSREESESMAKYMQGATNIYALTETENCDATHPLNIRFFVPNETKAINKVLLSFKMKDYRFYTENFVVATDGTGDFDDIQTAIDALPAEGGKIFIKKGTYTLTSELGIGDSDIILEGEGYSTFIYRSCGVGQNTIAATSQSRLVIRNLRISSGSHGNCIHLTTCSFCLIQDCYFDTEVGVRLYGCSYITVDSCYFGTSVHTCVETWGGDGPAAEGIHCEYLSILNNYSDSSDGYFCALHFTDNSVIRGNYVFGITHSGMKIGETGPTHFYLCVRNMITNNYIYTTGTGGTAAILMNNGANNIISSNVLWAPGGYGYSQANLAACTDNLLHGNQISAITIGGAGTCTQADNVTL